MAASQPADQPLEADVTEEFDENDSALGDEDFSSTTSITSSIARYRQENGRTYHAYKEGKYLLPNDESENDRLDLQHHMYYLTLSGKLFLAPVAKEKLHRVLDLGTGTGIWAIDFADEHSESQVIGVDLSPIQPEFVPPNCSFEIDDIEEPWTYRFKFDFIHMRMMVGSVANFPHLFEQAFANLNPGGWFEVKDIKFPMEYNDDNYPRDSAVQKWNNFIMDATIKFGRDADKATGYKQQLIDAGFENVTEVMYKWPQNMWPKDRRMKELGAWQAENFTSGLSGLSMALFTRALGWTAEELEVFLVDVRKSMKDTKIHGYYPIYVVYGQKPA